MVGKKIKGRKRHIITDSQGHILHIEIHAANIHDTISGCKVVEETLKKYQDLQIISGDMGYRGTCFKYVTDILKKTMIISEKIKSKFIIQPMRWVVERTFSWLNEYRRLAKDFEYSISSEKNFIMIAHSIMLLRRD